MSLYYDAVSILTTPSSTGGSFKSRLYTSRNLKASPAQIYALITEAAKWDILLKEVIDAAGILKLEPKLTPLLSLLLVHDHLLAKNGIAANANHPLRTAIERHKVRLKGEFTKARVRRSCASIPDLKDAVRREKIAALGPGANLTVYPRWVRINNVRTTMEEQMKSTFAGYKVVKTLEELVTGDEKQKKMRLDPHIPDLIAVAPGADFSISPAYKNGEIILQDKASCFPAYLLCDETWDDGDGDLVDGCAAPGNKTTHMASLLYKSRSKSMRGLPKSHIISMDASAVRAKTLQKMVSTAGADNSVTVLQGQDFLALDPEDPQFENVTGLLLDPSCSGSGIIGRDDVPKLVLPAGKNDPIPSQSNSKKRKRDASKPQPAPKSQPHSKPAQSQMQTQDPTAENELIEAEGGMSQERLLKLSNLQTRIVTHALSFPAARKISYSTCSIHLLENECVVQRILESEVARRRGWRVMRRDEQPEGLRKWGLRGVKSEKGDDGEEDREVDLEEEDLQGCLRCWPGDVEGTGGFFVVGFVREREDDTETGKTGVGSGEKEGRSRKIVNVEKEQEYEEEDSEEDDDDDEWGGFSD
ncbi:S-adenosyl-L-methionine-dependent methyltransferase [Aspergillus karnatakaensis]|uniref:rRNA (cytosine-C5-)-methyltransferase RCM1 n=1 Tax=Aspergillus karnatakaensis TaxID=1810916 RepID=UPI003CCD7A3C